MKGSTDQSFNLIYIVLTFIVVLAIVFAILSSGNSSLKSFHDMGCNICNIFVGNFMSGITFHVLNPCSITMNCCDSSLSMGGASGSSAGCYGNLGTTTSTVRTTTTVTTTTSSTTTSTVIMP